MLNLTLTSKMVPKQSFFDLQQRKLFSNLKLKGCFFPQGKTHLSLSFFIAAKNFSSFQKQLFDFLYSLKIDHIDAKFIRD